MSNVKIFPLDFMGQGALLQPKNQQLHDLIVDFCAREVIGDVNLVEFSKVFAAAEVDEADKPINIEGVSGYVLRPDIALFRAVSARATSKLHHRWHTFFADSGIIGHQVLLHLNSKERPEQRCTNWEEELKAAKAELADRYLVTVAPK